MSLLRSRAQPASRSENAGPVNISPRNGHHYEDGSSKGNRKSFFERNRAQVLIFLCAALCLVFVGVKTKIIHASGGTSTPNSLSDSTGAEGSGSSAKTYAPMGSIVYGAKSKGDHIETAKYVKQAIEAGFRHIATGGFHSEYYEGAVGTAWKESGVPRNQLYLQTLFVARAVNGYGTHNCNVDEKCPPSAGLSIEEEVRLSVESSLNNLQSDYIDAVLVHNFRAKLEPYENTMRAWRTLEEYVDKGTIRHLGIVSVHDKEYLTKLHDEARVKPSIIQNRFHSNRGYDVELRPKFKEWGMANQLFWILTGSAGGRVRNNEAVKRIAEKFGVSPQIALYSFTMELGGTPLIGSKSSSHMKDDVEALVARRLEWEKKDLEDMAGVINKNLIR